MGLGAQGLGSSAAFPGYISWELGWRFYTTMLASVLGIIGRTNEMVYVNTQPSVRSV